MDLKNIFKKKKKPAQSQKGIMAGKTAEKLKAVDENKEKVLKTAKRVGKETPKIAPKILVFPRITEKAMALAEQGQYVFKVFKTANKIEIKKAINETYGVAVEKVRIVNVPRKQRRLGKIKGWKQGYKKAIITVKKGQKIDIV